MSELTIEQQLLNIDQLILAWKLEADMCHRRYSTFKFLGEDEQAAAQIASVERAQKAIEFNQAERARLLASVEPSPNGKVKETVDGQ